MKTGITVLGIFLIVTGILFFVYKGFTYNTQEKIAQLGPLKITQEAQKTVNFPPVLGGLTITAGIVLVLISRRVRK